MSQLKHLDGRPQSWEELYERVFRWYETHTANGERLPETYDFPRPHVFDRLAEFGNGRTLSWAALRDAGIEGTITYALRKGWLERVGYGRYKITLPTKEGANVA